MDGLFVTDQGGGKVAKNLVCLAPKQHSRQLSLPTRLKRGSTRGMDFPYRIGCNLWIGKSERGHGRAAGL
jgi:hypothetical protein